MIEKEILRRAIREEIQRISEGMDISAVIQANIKKTDKFGGAVRVVTKRKGGNYQISVTHGSRSKMNRIFGFWNMSKGTFRVTDSMGVGKVSKKIISDTDAALLVKAIFDNASLKEGRILTEARLPKDINDVTIMMLHTGMNKAVIKLLDGVKARTGSNANPISIQILDGWSKVKKEMMSKGSLKGQDAVDWFLHVALTEFNTDAPFISGLFRKYKLNKWKY